MKMKPHFVVVEKQNKAQKKYSIPTVAQAIGISENSIYSYFSNRKISTRGGITLEQIYVLMTKGVGGGIINWGEIPEIYARLEDEYGLKYVPGTENQTTENQTEED